MTDERHEREEGCCFCDGGFNFAFILVWKRTKMRRIMIDLDVGLLSILKGASNHSAKRGYETLPEKKLGGPLKGNTR